MKTEFDDALRGIYTDHDEVQQDQTTDYRQVATYAVGSLVFGILSAITFLHWSLAIFPILGLVLGIIGLKKILHAPDEVGGFTLTTCGIALSVVFWIGGYGWLAWSYFNSVPAGYIPIHFLELAADPKTGKLPEHIVELAEKGEKIFITGYMYPARKMAGIEDFTLVRTTEHCKFCSPTTNPCDMIYVHMIDGQRVSYRTRTVRVGGTLSVNQDYALTGTAPYSIDADVFR